MREILFRAKRKDNSEWVYGDLRQHKNSPFIKEDFYTIDTMQTTNDLGENHTVICETIGEYTGLTDKNGNKMFEGDIIYLDVSNIYATVQVVFQDGAFGYLYPMTETEFDFMSFSDSEYGIDTQKNVEILGNIFDNKDIKLCKDMGRRIC